MLARFFADTRANFALVSAIAMVPIIAAVAGAVDVATVARKSSDLRNALDAAGLAIAADYYSGKTQAELAEYGEQVFRSNLRWDSQEQPGFSYSSADNGITGAQIDVSSAVNHSGFIGWTFWNPKSRSVVSVSPAQPACMLALHPTAPSAVSVTGSTTVSLEKCWIASNSSASNAIARTGSARLSAECVTTVGSTTGLGSYTNLDCPQPLHAQVATPDPLRGVQPPANDGCEVLPSTFVKLLTPGTYCAQTFSGAITMAPGTYVLRGGEINLGGGGSLIGVGVTIFLMEGAKATIEGNQVVQLSAPSTGKYAGITIFQERDNNSSLTLQGNAGSTITGFIYAPDAHIRFAGDSSATGAGKCVRIIASTIQLTGNNSFSIDCTEKLAGRNILAGQQPVIVR